MWPSMQFEAAGGAAPGIAGIATIGASPRKPVFDYFLGVWLQPGTSNGKRITTDMAF